MRALNPDIINADILPQLHRELAELIGLPATLALGERYNGVHVYIPQVAHEDHDIAKAIGFELFEVLVANYQNEELRFPKLDAAFRQIKARVIAEMTKAQCPIREIALNTGYTQRRVQQIRSELKIRVVNDRQNELF